MGWPPHLALIAPAVGAAGTVPRVARTIVIAVDTEERTLDAIALGRVLAASTGAPAKLVTVFPYVPVIDDPDAPELVQVRAEARETLTELGREMALEHASVEVIAGSFAARELQHITERDDTGLIVLGSTTRGPIGRLLIGGVGERLLSGAASPVAIAPRGYRDAAPARLTRIGVGVDGSEEARHALEAAVALARASGASVRVITAFQRLAFGGVATAGIPSASANEAMRAQLKRTHEDAVATARRSAEADGAFVEGPAGHVLRDQAADLDLVVAGSRGYGPLGAVLMGSTTAALARGAPCPLLVIPRGTRFDL
jgi:nucleotide-binding universal stress UspA family protein